MKTRWGPTNVTAENLDAFRYPIGKVTIVTDVSLDEGIQLYAWRGRHLTAHITSLREGKGWH